MNTRILAAIALCAVFFARYGICQREKSSEPTELAPQRIVGLKYPRLAHLALVQGHVELEAIVSSQGAVVDVRLISGPPLLVGAAKDSLRQWRFTGCSALPVHCSTKVIFIFVLEKELCDIDQCPNDVQIDLPGTVTIRSKSAKAIVD